MAIRTDFDKFIELWFNEKFDSLFALALLLSMAQSTQFSISPHFLKLFYDSTENTKKRLNRAKHILNELIQVDKSDALSNNWYKTGVTLSTEHRKMLRTVEDDCHYLIKELSKLRKQHLKMNPENLLAKMKDYGEYCQILSNAGLHTFAICAANLHDADRTSYRTDKSTAKKRNKRDKDKKSVLESANKFLREMKLKTVRNHISQSKFIKMIKDDLPNPMSEKKISILLHELQVDGKIKFDPRNTGAGKM